MKLNAFNLLAFAASVGGVSEQLIKNYCNEDVYVTLYFNSSGDTNGPFILASGQAWVNNITGKANTATISKSADVWQPIPKVVLGTTSDDSGLWWSLSNVTGNPFANESFAVTSAFNNGTSPNICSNATSGDQEVHTCPDANVTLTLSLC